MCLQGKFLCDLGRTFLFFCSRQQIIELVTSYNEVTQTSMLLKAEKHLPRRILSNRRKNVDFYKRSTVRIILHIIGLLFSLGYFIYWIFFFRGQIPFFQTYRFLSAASMLICAGVSIGLWASINGESLIYLSHFMETSKLEKRVLFFTHFIMSILILYINKMLQPDRFLLIDFLLRIGVTEDEIGVTIGGTLTVLKCVILLVLFASLWGAIKHSVLYFSISYHSILSISTLLLVESTLSDMATTETLSKNLANNEMLYIVSVLLFTALFVFRYLYVKRKYNRAVMV